ncbi:MAG: ATP synthase subunit I [Burkholderiaceae bacterium]|nr:ATP synthase subunit I [Burkholderiaceae bacterium]
MLTTALLSRHLKKQKAKGEAAVVEVAQASVKMLATEYEDAPLDDVVPLTAEQATLLRVRLRKTGSLLSPWRVIAGQTLVGFLLAGAAWVLTGKAQVAVSVAYGALAVVIPAALFARGLMSQFSSMNAITAGFGFFIWEMIKIAVSIVLIAVAPNLVADLDWLAMLIGLIVTMKAVWLVLWLMPLLGRKAKASK